MEDMQFYGTQEQLDALSQKNNDEWITREKYKETIAFAEWLSSHDIVFTHDTDEGKIYDYSGIPFTMIELHKIYLNTLAESVYGKGVKEDYEEGFVDGYNNAKEINQDIKNILKVAYYNAFHKGYNVGQKDAQSHPLALTIANHIHNDFEQWFEQYKK